MELQHFPIVYIIITWTKGVTFFQVTKLGLQAFNSVTFETTFDANLMAQLPKYFPRNDDSPTNMKFV